MLAIHGLSNENGTGKVTRKGALMVCLVAVALTVSACGRRGSLEAPPSETVETVDEDGNVVKREKPKEDKPFILDPLL